MLDGMLASQPEATNAVPRPAASRRSKRLPAPTRQTGIVPRGAFIDCFGRQGRTSSTTSPPTSCSTTADLVMTIGLRSGRSRPGAVERGQVAQVSIHLDGIRPIRTVNYRPDLEAARRHRRERSGRSLRCLKNRQRARRRPVCWPRSQASARKVAAKPAKRDRHAGRIRMRHGEHVCRSYLRPGHDALLRHGIRSSTCGWRAIMLVHRPRQILISDGQRDAGRRRCRGRSRLSRRSPRKVISVSGDGDFCSGRAGTAVR